MSLSLIIFDLDGTLVDSSADICGALNYALTPYGLSEVSIEETISLVGEGATALVGKVIRQKAPGLDLPVVMKRFLEHYSAHMTDASAPYPGVVEALERLSSFRKAVVSNKLEAFSIQLLQSLGLLKYFNYVSGGDTSSEKKPSPIPIIEVLSRFDALPRDALFVGDSIYDMRAAKAAGLRAVAVLYGYGPPGFSEEADYTIDRIGDLVDIVTRLAVPP